jgi:hypothetical protein
MNKDEYKFKSATVKREVKRLLKNNGADMQQISNQDSHGNKNEKRQVNYGSRWKSEWQIKL